MNKKLLWDSILQQAISGKLVPQLDTEPAVEQIGPDPAPDEVPFELPEKWKWVKLKSIGQIIGGGTPSSSIAEYWDNPTVNWITSADLRANKGIFISSGARGISQLGLQKSSAKLFPAGTVIYTTRGACIGDVAIAAQESCTNQGCKSFVPDTAYITSLWGYYALMHAAPFIRRLSSGTTFAEISGKRFSEIAIPLPSIEEQRRIVAKLEELKPLVDQFGEAYDKLSELEADFPRKLKASILQAAMQGKLVPQLDTEPAVEQIGPAPAHTEETFELPEKWKWVKMSDISASIRYGYTASANTSGNVKLLRVTDLQDSQVNWNTVPCCEIDSEDLPRFKLEKYDIVIARSGSVGKSFVVDHLDTSKSCVFASYLIRIRLNSEAQVNISFIKYYLNSPFYWQSISLSSRGTTLKNVNAQQLGGLLVPLPPLEEQRRIVERIEQLFAEVNKMSACKAP